MLRKIISIKNVGRFLRYSAAGDVVLKRYNLVFAENGRGKTTLCAVLRSLQYGDASYVLGRTTLGTIDAPEISILLNGRTATFRAGAWNVTVPTLAIFDSKFVSENVFSGDAVDLSHKRNLYQVIIGEQGVELARKIEELDAAGREKSTEIREKLAAVQALVPQSLTVEAFLALQEDSEIDSKIAEKEQELQAVRVADQIKNRADLSELALPMSPPGFDMLLSKTTESISADAEQRVAEQIKAHAMHDRGETWLSEGLGYIRDNACPFCGQALDSVATLIHMYKAYFSEAYNALRTEIAAFRQEIESVLGDRDIASVERLIDQNAAAVEFWSRYCQVQAPSLAGGREAAGEILRTLRQDALALVSRKAAMPLDQMNPDAAYTAAKADLARLQTEAVDYNRAIRTANAAIVETKAATADADVKTVENALTLLCAMKKRHEPDVITSCTAYERAQAEKEKFEKEKQDVKKRLDEYTKQLVGSYEQTINRFLDDFNAGFRITRTSHGYPGGVASASYQISINETPVELGDSDTPIDRPSFKNTLSSGDKSTLALAFFLAKLEHDPEMTNRIVIFDDPFNSQDNFRKDCTVQKIKQCGDSCRQVIVLSHDQSFLKRIWDRLAPQTADRKCLQLARIGVRDTKISVWDIEQATQASFFADRESLVDYYNSGDGTPRDIVKKIRPVLETYCKILYPGDFETDALGIIIGKIRTAGATHQLFPLVDDLDALNEYTCRYHHGENPNAAVEPIDDTELQGFVKKTLVNIGGC